MRIANNIRGITKPIVQKIANKGLSLAQARDTDNKKAQESKIKQEADKKAAAQTVATGAATSIAAHPLINHSLSEPTITIQEAMIYAQSLVQMPFENDDLNTLAEIEKRLVDLQKYLKTNNFPGLNRTVVKKTCDGVITQANEKYLKKNNISAMPTPQPKQLPKVATHTADQQFILSHALMYVQLLIPKSATRDIKNKLLATIEKELIQYQTKHTSLIFEKSDLEGIVNEAVVNLFMQGDPNLPEAFNQEVLEMLTPS